MDYRLAKFAAAGAVVGLIGVGGASLASAQDDTGSSTSTTVQSSTDTTADSSTDAPATDADHDGKSCPDKAADSDTTDTTTSSAS
jgi:hypothetical protein